MAQNTQPETSRRGELEGQLRGVLRKMHYSLKTEESYVGWYRRYVLWHGKKHPRDLGTAEVSVFLTHLAVNRGVSAATQNQALNAIVFLYKNVLGIELVGIDAERAVKKKRLPVVLTVGQVGELFKGLTAEPTGLVARLLMTDAQVTRHPVRINRWVGLHPVLRLRPSFSLAPRVAQYPSGPGTATLS